MVQIFDVNFFSVAFPLGNRLKFDSISQCPLKLDASGISYGLVEMSWASSNSGNDGTEVRINGEGAFGMVMTLTYYKN